MMDSRRTPDAGRRVKNAPLDADAGHRRPTTQGPDGHSTRRTRSGAKGATGDARGINLITTLFILIAISAIGLLLYRVTTTEQEASVRQLYSGEALYIAEAGVAWAVHNLESDCDWGQPGETPRCHELELGAYPITYKSAACIVQLPNGTAYISVTEWGGVDVDADTENCAKRTIDSVGRRLGTSGRILAERRIRTTVD